MPLVQRFESLESRRLMSASVDVWADPLAASDEAGLVIPIVPATVTRGQWDLMSGSYAGTYTDVKNTLGADYHLTFSAQHHGFLHASLSGNGDSFTATGTVDAGGKVNLVYRLGSHRYYFYGQLGKGGTRLAGTFSIRDSGQNTAWGTFLLHKQRA